MEKLGMDEEVNVNSFILSEGCKTTTLTDKYQDIELETREWTEIRNSCSSPTVLMRRLLEKFIGERKIAFSNRKALGKEKQNVVASINGNFIDFI